MKRDVGAITEAKTGRPRLFDESAALNQAMLVFWEHGYESTSMSVLSAAMNMNAPSIYSAFGDKQSLFLKTLDLYVGELEELKVFVEQFPSSFEAINAVLIASVVRFTGRQTPRGCMLASSTASCSAAGHKVQFAAAQKRARIEEILKERIERDLKLGILKKTSHPSTLASLALTTIQGLSVLARDGASRKKLLEVAALSMSGWSGTLQD